MKRFLAILMVLTLALCCLAACGKKDEKKDKNDGKDTDTTGAAQNTNPPYETQVEVEGGTLEVKTSIDGDTLYASVVMASNPGFAGFALKLEFDNTKCVAREITASDLIDYETITSNIQQSEDKSAYTSVDAFWVSPTDITGDGVLFTVAFDIKDAEAEDFGFKLVCPKDAFSNQKLESVTFTVK